MSKHTTRTRPLAVVTGASSGIGHALAWCCASHGFDLLIAADEPAIEEAANQLRSLGAQVEALQVDMGSAAGVDQLARAAAGRDVSALLANAAHGIGRSFLQQDFRQVRQVIDTNITGTIDLVQRIGGRMQLRGHGGILITGSVADLKPGYSQAVCNGTKAFIDAFSLALRNELKASGVTVTWMIPGVADARFYHPQELATCGFNAMMNGDGDVMADLKNKLHAALARLTPSPALADRGSAKR